MTLFCNTLQQIPRLSKRIVVPVKTDAKLQPFLHGSEKCKKERNGTSDAGLSKAKKPGGLPGECKVEINAHRSKT